MFGKKIVLMVATSVLLFASSIENKKVGQPLNYVYSSSKIEYADVVTIERLKRAVVLLINKVEALDKKLKQKNNIEDVQTDSEQIKYLTGEIEKIRNIAIKNSEELSHLFKRTDKKSEYDEKIIEFINKK